MIEKELRKKKNRENEKGAALVMALLISFLLLVASAGILLETAMNTANVTDATADQQAYNAAESGIQAAIDVLRGNPARQPQPLLNPSKPASDVSNQIDFVKAVIPSYSNTTGESSLTPRLSRWITYKNTYPDRVVVGETPDKPYTPQTGYAFSLALSDPDNTGTLVSYYTTGRFFDSDADEKQKTWTTNGSSATIKYTPVTVTNKDVSSGTANTNYGTFTVIPPATGTVSIAAFNRFEILLKMTKPYVATKIIRGYIQTGTISSGSITTKIIFDSQTFTLMGSVSTLNMPSGANVHVLGPPQRVGYEAPLVSGVNTVNGTITPAEPTRLLIRSTGYGPRGATKRLEAIVQKNFFNGLSAPATLTLVGPRSTTNPASTFVFNPGSSNVTQYSGDDVVSTDIITPIGTTDDDNLDDVQESVDGQPPHPFNGTVIGTPSDVTKEMPEWLQNPRQLENAVQALYRTALNSGSYYQPGQSPSNIGDNLTAKGLTFVDGDFSFSGSGGGILVVTGSLTFNGSFDFNGLIIVTGAGGVQRSGGGNGTLQGNIVVAPYDHSRIMLTPPVGSTPAVYEDKSTITTSSSFLAPRYDLSGGGNSTIVYNSSSVANGMTAISNIALGVAEK
ncbi:MAG TPA: pilus assembly PilX N-terminal domain-containing protein [Pyrinomonadaceae bacterium]|jgi:hypothetical protein